MTNVMKIVLVWASVLLAVPCLGQEKKGTLNETQDLRFEGAETQTLLWETGKTKTTGRFEKVSLETVQFKSDGNDSKMQSSMNKPIFGPSFQSIKIKSEDSKSTY